MWHELNTNPNFYKMLHKYYEEDLENFRKDLYLNSEIIRYIILNNVICFDIDNYICHNPFELECILYYFHGNLEDVFSLVKSTKSYPVLLEFKTTFKNGSYGALTFIPYITELD